MTDLGEYEAPCGCIYDIVPGFDPNGEPNPMMERAVVCEAHIEVTREPVSPLAVLYGEGHAEVGRP